PVGCGSKNPAGPPASSDHIGLVTDTGKATGVYCLWQHRVALAVFTDVTGSGTAGIGPPGPKYHWEDATPDGRRIAWTCETGDGRSGAVTINGQEYDLAKGPLFLVTVRGEKTQVSQLQRDFGKMEPGQVHILPRDDPDVAAFIAQVSKS